MHGEREALSLRVNRFYEYEMLKTNIEINNAKINEK